MKTARPMCVLDVIVPDNQADDIARLMIDAGRTGRSGDGHVFITAIESSYAIKSGWMEGL
jgi:nitrogen regulatory protein P-II 1